MSRLLLCGNLLSRAWTLNPHSYCFLLSGHVPILLTLRGFAVFVLLFSDLIPFPVRHTHFFCHIPFATDQRIFVLLSHYCPYPSPVFLRIPQWGWCELWHSAAAFTPVYPLSCNCCNYLVFSTCVFTSYCVLYPLWSCHLLHRGMTVSPFSLPAFCTPNSRVWDKSSRWWRFCCRESGGRMCLLCW